MKRVLKRIWERLRCEHEYKYERQEMLHAGMKKAVYHKCEKCGKEQIYYV